MVIHSSFPDFVLFLYVHVAQLDHTFDPNEMSTIKAKMAKLFPEGTDLEKKLYQTIREYNRFDRSKINQLCEETLLHFKADGATLKSRLFKDFEDIIMADGQIHQLETRMLEKIRRIVDGK
jgi:uncharacterized tellurite resistance protein B-like protein